jgi:hypothetical protein
MYRRAREWQRRVETESSQRRFRDFQERVIQPFLAFARDNNLSDSVLLTWRFTPQKEGKCYDFDVGPRVPTATLVCPPPKVGMFNAVPQWFFGWEDTVFMADGMPVHAPTTYNIATRNGCSAGRRRRTGRANIGSPTSTGGRRSASTAQLATSPGAGTCTTCPSSPQVANGSEGYWIGLAKLGLSFAPSTPIEPALVPGMSCHAKHVMLGMSCLAWHAWDLVSCLGMLQDLDARQDWRE